MSTINLSTAGNMRLSRHYPGTVIQWFYVDNHCIGAYIHMNDGTFEIRSVVTGIADEDVARLFWEHVLNRDITDT